MIKDNIWKSIIIGLVCIALFTPLIVASGLYFPYVTGKVFAFRIISSVVFISWIILALKNPEYAPKKSILLAIVGGFVLWLGFANIFGVDVFNSFFSNFERMEGWFTHVYLLMYLIVISSIITTQKIWNWILNISIIVANIIGLQAAFDSVSRTQVILGNSTYVAIYILFNLFFVCFFLYRSIISKTKEDALKIVSISYYVLSAVLFVYVIFRTQTRGTVLALVFSGILFLILTAFSYWKHKKIRIISIVLTILAASSIVLFWSYKDSQFIQKNELLVRVATISATEGTGKARLVNWGIALTGIKENPIMGWGQENYIYVFAQKYDPHMYKEEPWFDRTHNAFLDWAIQGGIIATLLYMSIFLSALYYIYKSSSLDSIEKNILLSLIVAYGIHNMFVFDNFSSYLMFYTFLGFVIFHSNKKEYVCTMDIRIKQVIAGISIVLVSVISLYTIIKPITVARTLISALSQKDYMNSLSIYESILDKKTFGDTETGIRLLTEANKFAQAEDKKIVEKYFALVSEVGIDFEKSNDVRRLETYGTFLYQVGNTKKAIEVLEKARTLAPKRQNNLYALGNAYLFNKDINKAKEMYKYAYEVLPENKKAQTYYGAILFGTGDIQGKKLMEGYDVSDPFFMYIFGKLNMYGEVIKIRKERALVNPTDYQNKVSLAVAYYLNKQTPQAVSTIQEVQKAVPDFKAQGDYLIKEMYAGRLLTK